MSTVIVVESDPKIQLGLCCINSELRKNRIFCSRTLQSKYYTKEEADCRARANLNDLAILLEWNSYNNIHVFRLSSDMFPRITDTQIDPVLLTDYADLLHRAGEIARQTNQRITMHPGQYNQVGAQSQSVFDKTVLDLSVHAQILDLMGMDDNAIMTVHGGGTYGDKENTIRRWIEQFSDLPRAVKRRLVIEHCERQYNIEDCLHISEECHIPVIFDSHHFDCYNRIYDTSFAAEDYIPQVLESWNGRVMVAHVSEQKQGDGVPIGAHSDFVETLPSYFLNIPVLYERSVDIEVEAKAKEKAVKKLQDKYQLY